MQTGRPGEKLLNGVATMDFTIIQQNNQVAGYLAQ